VHVSEPTGGERLARLAQAPAITQRPVEPIERRRINLGKPELPDAGLDSGVGQRPVAQDGAWPDRLVVQLAPVEVDLDHLAQRPGRCATVPAGHLFGLELGFDSLRLLAAALDLAADLPLAARHRVDARVDDHLEAVAAGTDDALPPMSVKDESALSLTTSLTEGKRKVL
jgi:hypothetical protein